MSERLEAHFYLTDGKPEAFTISMYNFPYTIVKKNDRWQNHPANKMEMTSGLVVAVSIAIGEPVV